MNEDILIQISGRSGGQLKLKLVPEFVPGVNGRLAISGKFSLFVLLSQQPLTEPLAVTGETQMSFVGNIRFYNENFFEWRYDGDSLTGKEVNDIVSVIQENVETWLSWMEHQTPTNEFAVPDPEDAFIMSDEQLAQLQRHPLYHIAPYFLFGPDDHFVAIIQNGDHYDIHINGEIVAELDNTEVPAILSGEIALPDLLPEIIRRVVAIRAL